MEVSDSSVRVEDTVGRIPLLGHVQKIIRLVIFQPASIEFVELVDLEKLILYCKAWEVERHFSIQRVEQYYLKEIFVSTGGV